jgi:hypothetical protein
MLHVKHLAMSDLDACTCTACQPEEITIETPAGTIRWQDALKKLSGSYFDHPDCRVAVEDYEEESVASET